MKQAERLADGDPGFRRDERFKAIGGLKPALQGALLLAAALAAAGCGFRPVYATNADSASPLFQRIALGAVIAPETVEPFLVDALQDRMALKDGEAPKYELIVTASEVAERLAVQIDATVTRYNYRLEADYKLTDLSTGLAARGAANAVVSYNIVSSQYSTLFAERKAQEKAATILAREIERDLVLRSFDRLDETVEIAPIGINAETEILQDPLPGEAIQPRKERQPRKEP